LYGVGFCIEYLDMCQGTNQENEQQDEDEEEEEVVELSSIFPYIFALV
jgi:hypothetical protein